MHDTIEARGAGARSPAPASARRRNSRILRALAPLPWIGPAIILIVAVVLWPVVEMVWTSLMRISSSGATLGFRGTGNYHDLFGETDLVSVLLRTVVWVVGVVVVTIVVSLAIGQLLNANFPGRRVVRWAVIVPWAASVLMTALTWKWMLNYYYGVVNKVLKGVGLIDHSVNWLSNPTQALIWMMWVAVFVSLPFTSFVILAGLQTVPQEVYEAARVDGAGRARTYFRITLPLLRPALLVAAIINVINVFNSFPIIYAMTGGGPGSKTDTSTTFMYKLAFSGTGDVGESAAMAVVNFALILILVLLYLRAVGWRGEAQP
ncbi:carbohydrate ABC transporter permease [Actinoallomurus iriomotensis]|uniref:ABC transporter permease n=1 Tax=Actinoallomurus iriomotensis TaxID=478107 RepID=A0A9W6RCP6_9ACTN|nr:sugar ABC transporter permease [Actinoallomurus iriomotensis]GLY73303.1 ABC transporter permease [Actinoallomurus iriomotensis]